MIDLKKERLEAEFREVDQLIKVQEFITAKELLFRIIEEDPAFGKAYNHLAWIYETQEKRPREAEEYYKKAIELSPDYPASYLNYLYLLNTEMRGAEAEALLEKAKDIKGINSITLLNEWAYMLEYTGRFEEAIEKYRELIPRENDMNRMDKIKTDIERCRKKAETMKF